MLQKVTMEFSLAPSDVIQDKIEIILNKSIVLEECPFKAETIMDQLY